MADKDILSQDEIDALLHGVDSGEVEAGTDEPLLDNVARAYDFANQERIVRGRLPTLEMINQRFVRYFRVSIFNLLRRAAEITLEGVQMIKFADYMHGLYVPTSLSIVGAEPLRGKAIVNMDSKLVFGFVDCFFGGDGRFHTKIEGRDFTATELRVVRIVLDSAFRDFQRAWKPVLDLEFSYQGHEVNPHLANIVSPSEIVVVSNFRIELEGGTGDMQLTMPYAMVEPIRQLLDAGIQSDRADSDMRWNKALHEQIFNTYVNLHVALAETTVSVKRLTELRPGDILPIDEPSSVVVIAEDIPLFRGRYGESRGNAAVRLNQVIKLEEIDERIQREISS